MTTWRHSHHFNSGVGSMFYLGRKTRFIDHYPAPRHPLIIEPFAGSASFSVHHREREVLLLDVDNDVQAFWTWVLDGCPSDDLRAQSVLRKSCQKNSSQWTSFASSTQLVRRKRQVERLAEYIAGRWRFIAGDYRRAPDVEATWFIDPPYQRSADQYRADALDYAELWRWCSARKGQVILCEAADNDWIPEPVEVVRDLKTGRGAGRPRGGKRVEICWHRPS
jgi:16S rRNA G966 N2-methylase RsmD